MRDDPEYWDALTARVVATVRERRQSSWLEVAIWAPTLATAAALMLLLANGRAREANRTPNIAMLLTAPGQAPSIVAMLRGQP
jgi:hypothetical protein